MEKPKKSGPAIFMYIVIAVGVLITLTCFTLYYGNFFKNDIVLWIGVTAFTIIYHFWGRIILGNVTKLFHIHYSQPWFRERKFEKKLYKLLRVQKWKDKVLTYNPELFDMKTRTLDEIANTMAKAETDHWVNELLSLTTLLFPLIWGEWWVFTLTAVVAMIFDAQFILVQRYNRPKAIRVIKHNAKKLDNRVI